MGERLAYYQIAADQLTEAVKLSKGLDHPEVRWRFFIKVLYLSSFEYNTIVLSCHIRKAKSGVKYDLTSVITYLGSLIVLNAKLYSSFCKPV